MLSLSLLFLALIAVPGPVSLVEKNRAIAAIVLPESPFPIATFAAEELVYHIEQATGATLPIVREPLASPLDGPVIYVGATQAARDAGIDPDALASEVTVLRSIDDDLYIVGRDGPGEALSTRNSNAGTLWGVYEILERYLGVRWIWPGALGEVIPKTESLAIPPLDEQFAPRFDQRLLRPGLGPKGFTEANERLAFSPAARAQYAADQTLFLRRHRMGLSDTSLYAQRSAGHGHSFEGWWEEYGAEHPDWFQLNADGTRGPTDANKPNHVTMCVSNPGLHAEIVRRWQAEREAHPEEQVNIGIGENDTQGACLCDACTAWDGPPPNFEGVPEGVERSYEPMQASNRYARFLKAVHALASEVDPNVRVTMYAYENYFWAPDSSIKLDSHIVLGFVPWFRWAGWFPRTDLEQQWIKDQWTGWKRTGATLYYRPNWFLDGYTMPLVYMHQFADAFQFYAQHGMTGTDFDTLQGQWAAQGPNLYLLARIHVRPDAPVDELLAEYYEGFGPAANAVKAYFDYWETYAVQNSRRSADAIRNREGRFRRYAKYAQAADEIYPLAVFGPAYELLAKAEEAAGDDALAQQRVAFLQKGLRHAEQCVKNAAVINNPDSTLAERKASIAELIALRRELEGTGIANMDRAAIIETDSWKEMPEIFEP